MDIKTPRWVEGSPPERQAAEKQRFLLQLAALYLDPKGRLSVLSRACGLSDNTLATLSRRDDPLSPEIAIKIEQVVGRDILPRELIRPDLFAIAQG